MKAAIPANESQRIAALREYNILTSGREQAYDDIVQLVCYICDAPMATISFVDSDRQWFKARVGVDESGTSRDVAFCAHTILESEPLIVRDALEDQRFADSDLVVKEPRIRFYAGFPLTTHEGFALGSLCAMDREPRTLSSTQQTAMRSLARQVMEILELRRVSASLAAALDTIKTLEGLLPICAWCKRIRDEKDGSWTKLESYITRQTGTDFTHGICPDCMERVRPNH